MLCQRNIKRAERIVELYNHAAIFKNTSVLKKFLRAYITQQCTRNKFFYFFYLKNDQEGKRIGQTTKMSAKF